jgi:HAD superfamily hydrolase (TIGR01509 family)
VFFDVDGTLVDTNYLHTMAWWRALTAAGIEVTMARVHRLIGRSGDDLIRELTGETDQKINDAHTDLFAESRDLIRPIKGARALLEKVHAEGQVVVIVTSAHEAELQWLLKPLECEALLDEVVHGESVGAAKPAPDLYHRALEQVGLPPDRVVAIGDTGWDVKAAGRAGIDCVGVESGGVAACELKAAGATAVYGSCADLLADYHTGPLAPPPD